MNQGDHIRSMNNDELASLFITLGCCPDSVSRHACTSDDKSEDCKTCWINFLQKEYNGKRTFFDRLSSSVDEMAAAMVHPSWGIVEGEQEVIGYTSRFDPEIHDTESQAIEAAKELLMEVEE